MEVNPATKKGLQAMGFRLVGTIRQLQEEDAISAQGGLQSPGVYALACPDGYKHSFLELQETCKRNNVINLWCIQRLEAKWVDGVEVVYFGQAGRQLKERLGELKKHSLGHTSDRGPHKGGEIVWQLKHYETLEVLYLPTETPTQAKETEADLISEFCKLTGKLPFANKNRPRKR